MFFCAVVGLPKNISNMYGGMLTILPTYARRYFNDGTAAECFWVSGKQNII